MDYLFDINETSAAELHDVLGFVDASFTMIQLKPYLRSATKDMIEIVGDLIYDKAVEYYEDNSSAFSPSFSSGFSKSDEEEHELVTLLRYAIALGAFRQFAPLSDVSYTTSGRLFRTDENTKSAFEWMIDKSDAAMERSYYAALNEVIRFIMSEMKSDAPGITKKYRLSELFVYNLSVFQDYVSINDFYLLYFRLVPSLRMAQNRLIKPRVGGEYDFYKANEDHPANSLIQQICVYFAMRDGLKKESVQLFPRGVVKETSGSGKHAAAKLIDIETTVLYYDDELSKMLLDLENQVKKDNFLPTSGPVISFGPDDKFVTL